MQAAGPHRGFVKFRDSRRSLAILLVSKLSAAPGPRVSGKVEAKESVVRPAYYTLSKRPTAPWRESWWRFISRLHPCFRNVPTNALLMK